MSKRRLRLKSLALRGERRLSAGLMQHRSPAWSHDGELLCYSVGDENNSAWVVVDRRGRIAAHFTGPCVGRSSFSITGAMAFGRRFGNLSEIWGSPRPGILPVRLCGGDGCSYLDPAFSPDGKSLVYAVSALDQPFQIGVCALSSGDRRLITRDALRSDGAPAFSPDGQTLFFSGQSSEDDSSAIFAIDLDENRLVRITNSGSLNYHPAPLSRDWVVTERRETAAGRSSLVFVDRSSGRERALSEGELDQRDPACFVGGKGKIRIAYSSLLRTTDDHPPRFDVCTGRLKGLELLDEVAPPDGPVTEPFEKLSPEDVEDAQAQA